MNELIELNYLKRYKEKGKYALTKKGYEVINKTYRLLEYTYFHGLRVYNVVEG